MSSLFLNSIFSTTIIVVMDAEVSQKKKQDLQRLTIYILPNSVICLAIQYGLYQIQKFKILVFSYIPSLTDKSVGFLRKNFFVFPG